MGRQAYALAAALALHAAIALVLRRLDVRAPIAPSPSTIEIVVTPPRSPSPPPPPPSGGSRSTAPSRHRAAVAAAPTTRGAAVEPAPIPAAPSGPVELFPRSVLDGVAAAAPASSPSPAANDKSRETPQSWLDDAAAEARTRSGAVDHAWRAIERELVGSFKPPVDAVHDTPSRTVDKIGDRLKTWLQQNIAMVKRGEDGLRHPVEPGSTIVEFGANGSIDPSRQTFPGVPEGMNLRAMPLAQQQASVAATAEPASWLRAEIEITVDAAGNVSAARVAWPSGRRAFDRYALATVQAAVARAAPPSTVTRWICEAGYAVDRPDAFALSFDLNMLFDKKSRRQLSARYPTHERVDTRVALKWVKAASEK